MKQFFKIFPVILVLGFVTINLNAQNEPDSFSLEEARQYAMDHAYILNNSERDVTIAQKKVWEVISTGLPQVTGSANYNAFLNLPISLLPGEFFGEPKGTYIPVKFGQDFNSDFGLNVAQTIFDGSYIVGIGSSKIYVNLAKQTHEKSEIDIREAVTQAYFMVLIGQENEKVTRENLANTEKLYNETKIYFDNGFREEQDVDQMKLMVRNAENEVVKAEREIKIAKVVLKYTMGYPLDDDIVLTDQLANFLNPIVAENTVTGFDFTTHIDYRLSQINFQVSEKMLKLEKVTYLPRLSAFYSYSKTAYGNNANLLKSDVSWFPSSLVGFQLTMPIFESGEKMFKVQQARLNVEKAATQRKLAETTLQKDYLTAVADLESARERFENDQESRELALKIRDKTKIKFNNGISSSTELSQTETQFITAYQALVASTLQLLQADLKLKKATGNL